MALLTGHHSLRWAPKSLGCFTARILVRAAIFKPSPMRFDLDADYSYEVIIQRTRGRCLHSREISRHCTFLRNRVLSLSCKTKNSHFFTIFFFFYLATVSCLI